MLSVEALRREIVKMVKKMPGRENNVWKTKPAGWPDDIPFVDPNNIMENGKKPNKVILKKMHEHLKSVEDCQKVELQGSPKKATNEVMNVELLTRSSAIAKDIVKGTCPQLQELKTDLKKLSHCKEKSSKSCCGEIKKCIIKLRTCCDDVLSELEIVGSMRYSLDLPLHVMPTEAESLGIQFKKPENHKISSEQECDDVLKFLDIRDENASPVTVNRWPCEPMAIQTPFATGEHLATDTPHDTGELMAIQAPHDTGDLMVIQAPHDIGEFMAIQAPYDTGDLMAIQAPHDIGELMAIQAPHVTGELMVIQAPHDTGDLMAIQAPHDTGELMAIQTSHDIGELMAIQAPHVTGDLMDIQAPHDTGDIMVIQAPHDTGDLMAIQAPHDTGELMAIQAPPITNLQEVEFCNDFGDATFVRNHTNSVIVGDDVMWGMSVPSSERDDWLAQAHTAACTHCGCNEEDETFLQEKEIKANDSVRTSKRRASLSSDEPNAKRGRSSMRQF